MIKTLQCDTTELTFTVVQGFNTGVALITSNWPLNAWCVSIFASLSSSIFGLRTIRFRISSQRAHLKEILHFSEAFFTNGKTN